MEDARSFGNEPVHIEEIKQNIVSRNDLIVFYKLYGFLADRDFRIVHTQSSKVGILGRWAAYRAGVPTMIHTSYGLPFHLLQRDGA